MVRDYYKPKDIDDALAALAAPGAVALAGGTFLLAGSLRGGGPEIARAVDIFGLLPRGVTKLEGAASAGTPAASGSAADGGWIVGAGTTFQELIDAAEAPACLKSAALSMANRNTRNRATVGGNLGANKSCASLVPVLLALGASVEYRVRGGAPAHKPLQTWLAEPEGLVMNVVIPAQPAGSRVAALRASRTACDLATATAAAHYALEGGKVIALRVAMGGFGPHAALRPDLAALFEGKALPPKAEIEAAVRPLLVAKADHRGSAEYKRARGAALLADALHHAEVLE